MRVGGEIRIPALSREALGCNLLITAIRASFADAESTEIVRAVIPIDPLPRPQTVSFAIDVPEPIDESVYLRFLLDRDDDLRPSKGDYISTESYPAIANRALCVRLVPI